MLYKAPHSSTIPWDASPADPNTWTLADGFPALPALPQGPPQHPRVPQPCRPSSTAAQGKVLPGGAQYSQLVA